MECRLKTPIRIPSKDCEHFSIEPPDFDPEKAKGMSTEQVRKSFPRREEICLDCGSLVIEYYSYEHYIAGDW